MLLSLTSLSTKEVIEFEKRHLLSKKNGHVICELALSEGWLTKVHELFDYDRDFST